MCVSCLFVCLFVCLSVCSLFVGSLSLVAFVVVWLCDWLVVVVSVTLGASTRVSPDVARLKLSLPNRQSHIQTYRQTGV